jgi:hypothetical protein
MESVDSAKPLEIPAAVANGAFQMEEPLDDMLSWFMLNVDVANASDEMLSSLHLMNPSPTPDSSSSSSSHSGAATAAAQVDDLDTMFDEVPVRFTTTNHASTSDLTATSLARDRDSDDSDSDDDSDQDQDDGKSHGSNKRRKVTADSVKSRESAKQNRKRQRLRLEALASRVKALSEENEGLKVGRPSCLLACI